MVTAERETAILRADKAELKSRQLRQQVVTLQKKLGDYNSVRTLSSAESISSHLLSQHLLQLQSRLRVSLPCPPNMGTQPSVLRFMS